MATLCTIGLMIALEAYALFDRSLLGDASYVFGQPYHPLASIDVAPAFSAGQGERRGIRNLTLTLTLTLPLTPQNKTEQNRTGQNRTEQNRTEQNRTEQNAPEQNRT